MKIIFIYFLSIYTLMAQNFKLPLWENNIPNQNDVKVEEGIEITDKLRITAVDEPIMEVYLPEKSYATGEAVVIFPGGGYRILAYDYEGTDVAKWLNSFGIAGIVVKYRLPHTANNIECRLSPFLDAQRAVRLTRYNADKWGIKANKIGIMGFSAGGHLASTLGTHFEDNFFTTDEIDSVNCRPDFMILMYPVITFNEPNLHSGSRTNLIGENPDVKLVEYYSNELHISEKTPPTFLIHAADDKGVPVENSLMFFNNLKKNNIKSEMHIFENGGHGFGLAIGKGRLEQWKDLCISWIKDLSK
ncbi:MAG: alpha/beta hydrolase [Ignavibacteriales bacterium]|nr:alpha/beta hydrolase [Ignavibacteriales bacterium]